MLVNLYPARTFQQTANFAIPKLVNNTYTDLIISQLYNIFVASYANLVYSNTQSQIEGCDEKEKCKAKYLLMSLYVMRNWYNPNSVGYVVFPLTQLPAGSIQTDIIAVSTNGAVSGVEITNASGYGSMSQAYSQLALTLSEISPGWSISFTSPDTFTLTPSPGYTGNRWILVREYDSAGGLTFYNWYYLGTINPCISTTQMNQIIQNCIDICGGINCMTSSSLLSDSNFVPLGQPFSHPPHNITNLFPNLLFQ